MQYQHTTSTGPKTRHKGDPILLGGWSCPRWIVILRAGRMAAETLRDEGRPAGPQQGHEDRLGGTCRASCIFVRLRGSGCGLTANGESLHEMLETFHDGTAPGTRGERFVAVTTWRLPRLPTKWPEARRFCCQILFRGLYAWVTE